MRSPVFATGMSAGSSELRLRSCTLKMFPPDLAIPIIAEAKCSDIAELMRAAVMPADSAFSASKVTTSS